MVHLTYAKPHEKINKRPNSCGLALTGWGRGACRTLWYEVRDVLETIFEGREMEASRIPFQGESKGPSFTKDKAGCWDAMDLAVVLDVLGLRYRVNSAPCSCPEEF